VACRDQGGDGKTDRDRSFASCDQWHSATSMLLNGRRSIHHPRQRARTTRGGGLVSEPFAVMAYSARRNP
jgi:hypothetical protein